MEVIDKNHNCKNCLAFVQFNSEGEVEVKENCATFLFGHCQKEN